MRALPALLFATATTATAACNGLLGIPEPSHDPDAAVVAGVDAGDPTVVTGIARTVHVLETADTVVETDLGPPGVVEAWIPDPTQTDGFRKAPANVQDGSFEIPDVLNGLEYYLRYQPADEAVPVFLVTKSRVLDMTAYTSRRPDLEPVSASATSVSISSTGLSPAWQQTSFIDVWSWNAGAYLRTSPADVLNYPQSGDGALSDFTVNWFQPFPLADPFSLLDGGAQDKLQVGYLASAETSNGTRYERLTQLFSPAPMDMSDGMTTFFNGAFTDVDLDQSLVVQFQRKLFADYYYWMGRDLEFPAVDNDGWVFVDTLPWGKPLEHGVYPPAPDLFVAHVGPFGGDVNLGEITYGDPFSNGSADYVGAGVRARKAYSIPAISPGTNHMAGSIQVLQKVDGPGVVITALALPTGFVTLSMNGTFFDGGFFVMSASTDPLTLEWAPPEEGYGTADYYIVRLFRFYADGSFLRRTEIATFYTPNTTMLVPRTLFEGGSYYAMVITTVAAPNSDVTRRPFTPGLPYGAADAMSGVIRVAP